MGRALPLLGLALALAVTLHGLVAWWGETSDDAYVTFRYSQSLAEGRGPYYNPGEPVEGYTNFLLMLIVALAIAAGGPGAALTTAKAVGAAAALGSVVVAFVLARGVARELRAPPWIAGAAATLASLLLGLNAAFVFNATRGLETSLFGFLLCAGAGLALWGLRSGRWRGSGVAFAAACLTRPEGVAVVGVFWVVAVACHARGERLRWTLRVLALDAFVVGGVLVVFEAFRVWAYGDWLPNTYYAKLGGAGPLTATAYVWTGLSTPFLAGGGLLLGYLGLAFDRSRWRTVAPIALTGLAAGCLPLITGSDWMPASRLVAPYYPFLAAAVGLGWALLAARLPRSLASGLLVVGLAATWWSQAGQRRDFTDWTRTAAQARQRCIAPFARWLAAHAAPGDTLAMTDIGAIGFLNPEVRILDVTGLVDRHIAHSAGRFLNKDYDVGYVLDRKPRFITLVLAAHRISTPPAPDTHFVLYQPIERRIFQHPEFARWYVRPREPPPGATWLQRLAAQVGAAAAFDFPTKDQYYIYTVFERAP